MVVRRLPKDAVIFKPLLQAVYDPNGFYDSNLGNEATDRPSLTEEELRDLDIVTGILMGTGAEEFIFFSTEDAPAKFYSWDEEDVIEGERESDESRFWRDLGCLVMSDQQPTTSVKYSLPEVNDEGLDFIVNRWKSGHIGFQGRNLQVIEIQVDGLEGGAPSLIAVF